ncbi:uncharacterized protein [Anabrus simplex]|uniref:uncharacterized protein isoform X1 n=1 Tax=Anabrus simplex TaxID=316456 RepID=UPI0035A2A8B6
MNNNEDILHYSKLINILEEAVESTTRTKENLRMDCQEIKRLLSNWCLPEREVCQLERETTCDTPITDESDEIVKEVEETLEYAQKLRRSADVHNKNQSKLSKSNVRTANKFKLESTGINVRELHSPTCNFRIGELVGSSCTCVLNGGDSNRNHRGTCRIFPKSVSELKNPLSYTFKPINITKVTGASGDASSNKIQSNIPQPLSGDSLEKSKGLSRILPKSSRDVKTKNNNVTTSSTSRTKSGVGGRSSVKSKKSSLFQTTYQKDFAMRSKRVPSRPVRQTNADTDLINSKIEVFEDIGLANGNVNDDHEGKVYPLRSLSYVSASGTISGVELDKLIDRGSVKLDVTVTNSKKTNIDNCQHLSFTTGAIGSLREALDLQGIPPELVSILKCYHQFVGDLTNKHEVKGRTAADNFLVKLISLNQSNWSNASYEPLVGLYSEYLSLFGKIGKDGTNRNMKLKMQEMFECLESTRLRILNLDESSTPLPQAVMPSPRVSEMSTVDGSWVACGVWNARTRDLFNDIMGEHGCVHYHSGHHLRKLHGNLQKIQVLQLQLEVLNTLSSDLLPQLTNHNLCDAEFSLMYKTCSALSSLMALIVPTIVRVV